MPVPVPVPVPVTVRAGIQPETVQDGCARIEILALVLRMCLSIVTVTPGPQNGQVGAL